MRTVLWRSAAAAEETEGWDLDAYEVAFLAGGAQRVATSAVIALSERGLLKLRGARVRAIGEEAPQHPVEHAVFASCLRSTSVSTVHAALHHSPEVAEIGRRLAACGLVRRARRRATVAGRRQLLAAQRDKSLPAYVLDGPAVLPHGPTRRSVLGIQPIPSGLGRALVRMGKALDRDSDSASDSDTDSGGGFSCGGGGGGGD